MKYKNIICKNAKIIINPSSGKGKNKFPLLESLLGIKSKRNSQLSSVDIAKKVQSYLVQHNVKADIFMTEKPGHGTSLAASAREEGYDLVVAIGGDGTINEVVNGLVKASMPLAVVPAGTANVLSLEFGIPHNVEEACQRIIEGHCKCIDLGLAGNRYFTCMAGVGFDAHIIKKVDKKIKTRFGALSYVLVAIKYFFKYKFSKIHIQIDGEPEILKGRFLVVSNTKYYGGKFLLTPKADPSDGYLDLCLMKHKKIWNVLRYFFAIKQGNIDKVSTVEYRKVKNVRVLKHGKHAVHVDAEYIGHTAVSLTVEKGALWLVS